MKNPILEYIENYKYPSFPEWKLEKIKETYTSVQEINNGLLCITFNEEDPTEISDFAIFDGGVENEDSYELICIGRGYIRECRHTFFSPYLYYISWKLISSSFEILSKYFDFD